MSLAPAAPSVDTPPIEVPRILEESQVKQFVEDGFLIVPALLTDVELEELKDDILQIARGKYPSKTFRALPDTMSDAEVLAKILCVHQPHYISPVMRKYVEHAKIAGVLSQITGAHLAHWDGSVKCMQSMYFVKPPQFQGQAWHQDEIYIPTRDRSLVGAWIAIDDATIDNGSLWVIPGSHRTGYLYPQKDHNQPDEFDISQQSYGFDDSAEIPVEVKAGTVVFFNGHLLHRSRKNRSNIYRRVLVNHYMNAWSMLPWNTVDRKTEEPGARSDDRRIIPVAGIDPYAWKGYLQGEDAYMRFCKANTEPDS